MANPIDGFTVTKADISYVGQDLQRRECILAEPDGMNGDAAQPILIQTGDIAMALEIAFPFR